MKSIMNEPISTLGASIFIKHGLIALFGALAHAINAHRKGESKSFLDFILLTVLSSFSGIIFALLAVHMFEDGYITLAITGAGGYIGVEGLTLVSKKLVQLVANNTPENK